MAGAAPGGHPRHAIDEVVHAPVRFSICAVLAATDAALFAYVRDTVEVSDSVLSKQVSVLEAAGYVLVRKEFEGKKPRTWLSLTPQGRQAFGDHLARLRAIAEGSATPVTPP